MPTEYIEEPADYEDEIDVEAMVAEGEIVTEETSQDYSRVWDKLVVAMDAQTNVRALVVDASRGGLTVDLGVRGFIPKSEIATRNLNGLDRYIGQTLEAKVVEADREAGRVVLSQRKVADERRAAKRAETMAKLERGQTVEGLVRRITEFGAFVDIGGVDGLLHISDLSWEPVQNPADVVSVGQKVTVLVLKIERGGERISLGLKQLEEDPWSIVREFREGQMMEVEVTIVEAGGVVVKIAPGVEGLIPMSEIAGRPRRGEEETPVPVPQVGEKISAKILEIYPRDRRIILSLRQAVRDREKTEIRDYMQKQRAELAPPTLGDLFGDTFNKLKKR